MTVPAAGALASKMKYWREASTLILLSTKSKKGVSPNFVVSEDLEAKGQNMELLLLKRSSKSSFMPNQYVFPGGVADNADFHPHWIEIFRFLCRDRKMGVFEYLNQKHMEATPLFNRARHGDFCHIPAEVAFRLAAIRETFEESGILLCRPARPTSYRHMNERLFTWNERSFAKYVTDMDLIKKWRPLVQKDAEKFIEMCEEEHLIPDIWSLYEWSQWLTPLNSKKRFDTAFYVCAIDGDERPPVQEDAGEMVHTQVK